MLSASPRIAPRGTPGSASSLCSMGGASLGKIVLSCMSIVHPEDKVTKTIKTIENEVQNLKM